MFFRLTAITLMSLGCCFAAGPDPAWEILDGAYKSLRARDYDSATAAFRRALALSPGRVDVRKDLAYTYLKTGDTELARDEFQDAMKLSPGDHHLALEYAFLCYETKREAEAFRIFRHLRGSEPEAAAAFDRIDRELAGGIERWSKAVELTPDSCSAHEELADLAERRSEYSLAATHYLAARRLRPEQSKYLLNLGRVWQQQGNTEQATAALLAASRGAEPRVAELARALLPSRYPWVYEFRAALSLDETNLALRRELAFLLLEMTQKKEAEEEFRRVVASDSNDAWAAAQLGFLLVARGEVNEAMPLLEKALTAGDDELKDRVRAALKLPRELRKRPDTVKSDAAAEALHLAEKSFDAGYLKDAVRYLRIAHENDPLNFQAMVKLGWAYNLLHEDREAVNWFGLARRSPDSAVAKEAEQAWKNLRTEFARTRSTVWMYPMYSSRWNDLFSWAQYKTELYPSRTIYPYVSTRFAGDARRTALIPNASLTPAWLSESAIILAAGVSTRSFHGIRAWGEAGYGFSYLKQGDAPRIRPDIRGGISAARSLGRNFGTKHGIFEETNADFLYISRFDRDSILYAQNRAGYTLPVLGPLQIQLTWNLNVTADIRRFGWANTFESGPGIRLKLTSLPRPIVVTVDALSGRYTVLDNTRPPEYSDLRIGLWYAFSR